ncbi:hypothetical protein [Motilimonas eburnea]|uniref:hypothetical protein n=1 Tax=Motilimonas eburnea TaxID=1737488 RepID=UPI001E341949|nr:hypothetical protein [Motilimonas eburnea]MCE2572804.1 hypothetical protein [Motilimonas eburnea]
MKYKLSLLIDSLLSSGTNFLITFLLLKHSGAASVVSFGVAMTLSLIFLSFQRTIILIPFNLSDNKESPNLIYNFLIGSLLLFLISVIVVYLFLFFLDYSDDAIFLTFFLFSYLFSHELVRYLFMSSRGFFFPVIVSFSLFISVIQSVFFVELSVELLSKSYLFLLLLEMVAVLGYYLSLDKKSKLYNVEKNSLYWFSNPKLLLNRNLQSVSQLFLVHAPFLVVSSFFSSNISAFLFVSRSIYQPVQIVIKSLEAVDQRTLSSISSGVVGFVNKISCKYLSISFFSSLLCFFIGYFMLENFYEPALIPPIHDLIFWMVIFISLSLIRSVEMLLIKDGLYFYMNSSYFVTGFVVVVVLFLMKAFGLYNFMTPSFIIMLGWLALLVMLFLYYKVNYINVQNKNS